MENLGVPAALIDAERKAPRKQPEWVARMEARRFGARGDIGRLPGRPPAGDIEQGPPATPGGAA